MSGTGESYICARCGGEFVKTRSDEEALAEMAETWEEVSAPLVVVCDPCYLEISAWAQLDAPDTLRGHSG